MWTADSLEMKIDAAPVLLFHVREIVATESHAAHDVDFEHAHPLRIGNFLEWFEVEDTDVVDEDVDLRELLHGGAHAFNGAQIGSYSFQLAGSSRVFGLLRWPPGHAFRCGH